MPRQNRRREDVPRARPASAAESHESFRGEDYVVRRVSGSGGGGGRTYRCPGCDQLVAAASGHVVAWPARDVDAADRRHWHSTCWQAREHRAPAVTRGRAAPRY